MASSAAHQPPPASLVAALVGAGLSLDTVLAMEKWKAQEVLDLLDPGTRRSDTAATAGRLRPAW